MTIWRTRTACWITKVTNTHSVFVIFIAFPLQRWLYEGSLKLRYIKLDCLVKALIRLACGKSAFGWRRSNFKFLWTVFFFRPDLCPRSSIYLHPEGYKLWHLMHLGRKCHLLTKCPLIHNAAPSGLSGTYWSLWVKTRTYKVSEVFSLIFVPFKFVYNFAVRLLDQTFSTFTCCGKIRQTFCEEADNMLLNIKIKNE
jgi:hypothetical protein